MLTYMRSTCNQPASSAQDSTPRDHPVSTAVPRRKHADSKHLSERKVLWQLCVCVLHPLHLRHGLGDERLLRTFAPGARGLPGARLGESNLSRDKGPEVGEWQGTRPSTPMLLTFFSKEPKGKTAEEQPPRPGPPANGAGPAGPYS